MSEILLEVKDALLELTRNVNALVITQTRMDVKLESLEERTVERLDKLEDTFELHQHVVLSIKDEFHILDKKVDKLDGVSEEIRKLEILQYKLTSMESDVNNLGGEIRDIVKAQTKDEVNWGALSLTIKILTSKPVIVIVTAGTVALATKHLGGL